MAVLLSETDINLLRENLDYLWDKYDREEFIVADPISVPHKFSETKDIEIAGFLSSTIAWGNRKAIVKGGWKMMEVMEERPYDFTMNAQSEDLKDISRYVYRTFNGEDLCDFVLCLRRVCQKWGSLGEMFQTLYERTSSIREMLILARNEFFEASHNPHSEKHFSSALKGAACKRLNMYLRWMVRQDSRGVDFGIWKRIPQNQLCLPLDVHSVRMSHAFGILQRKQVDWKAVEEVGKVLRQLDPDDPIKYDYALFGAGIDGYLKNGSL